MLITNDDLIREFYETHPGLCGRHSIFKIKEIIASPFQYIKKEMANGKFRTFGIKKIGKLKFRVKYLFAYLVRQKKQYEKGKISKQQYLNEFNRYEKYIREYLALHGRESEIQIFLL